VNTSTKAVYKWMEEAIYRSLSADGGATVQLRLPLPPLPQINSKTYNSCASVTSHIGQR
jgi:hypothetical protein